MEQLNEISAIKNKHPNFLKVLCILSFVGCGILLISGLFGLKNLFSSIEELTAQLEMLQKNYPEAYKKAVVALEYKDINAIAGFITPLISLFGVIQIWRLKKEGFYIYLIGEIIPYILIFATTGLDSLTTMGEGMVSQSIINIFLISIVVFDVLFVFLYALNLKHMD